MKPLPLVTAVLSLAAATGCSSLPPAVVDGPQDVARLVEGPPVEDIVTPYDEALACMRGRVDPAVTFGVGNMVDGTSKETYANGGTGKFVTQGSGDMAQSALFRAGVTVVNRRDPAVPITETNWGIRAIEGFVPATFYVSGSVNSLDFIPGGGASVLVNGIGPKYRQNRILVGIDLALTDSETGIVVANATLQKQIFAREIGFSADNFFGTTLLNLSVGGAEREALNFALRQMVNLATLELLGAVAGDEALAECRERLGALDTDVTRIDASYRNPKRRETVRAAIRRARQGPRKADEAAPASPPRATAAAAQDKAAAGQPVPREALVLGRQATALAGRAIAAMEASMQSEDPAEAKRLADEAVELVGKAIAALRSGASKGLTGKEGDAAALVVEQAYKAAQAAHERARTLGADPQPADGEGLSAPAGPASANGGPPIPGTPEYQKLQGN